MRHLALVLLAALCSVNVQAQEYEMRSEFFLQSNGQDYGRCGCPE